MSNIVSGFTHGIFFVDTEIEAASRLKSVGSRVIFEISLIAER